jgi:hypothetical protein
MMYAVKIDSGGIIYVQSIMKIGTGVQSILRFCLSSLKGCDVGATDGGDL